MRITKEKANSEIRQQLISCGLSQWEVATVVGISEFTLCRWLRKELTPTQKSRVLSAIEKLKEVRYAR